MTDKQPPRTGIVPSDIDSQGNVVVWDHGPLPPKDVPGESEDAKKSRLAAHEADLRAWHDANGDGPVPVTLHSGDASHAMMIEPDRYSLEPHDLDEGEIEKRVKEKKDKRDAARDFVQNTVDRREAIAEMMSDARQKQLDKAAAPSPGPATNAPAPAPQPVEPLVPISEPSTLAQIASDDRAQAEQDAAARAVPPPAPTAGPVT